MLKTRQLAARTAAALVVVGGLVAVAAAPSSSQTVEVGATRGDAYGLLLDISSDLGDDEVMELPLGDLIESAEAGNEQAVSSLLAGTGIDFEAAAAAPNPEAVALTIGPIPSVTQPADGSGGLFTDSLANFSLLGLINFELAEVSTEGVLGPDGFSVSTADIENYSLIPFVNGDDIVATGTNGIAAVAAADAISVACEADLDGVSGSTEIVNGAAIILGPMPSTPGPNTNFVDLDVTIGSLNVVLNVTLNEQFSDSDDIEVTGIHTFLSLTLDTPGGPFNLLTIDKSMAHTGCGVDPIEVLTPAPIQIQPRFAG